jgi:hypothetical protein
MCMIVSHTLKLLLMFGLSFAILMRALLKLSHLIRTLQKPGEYLDDCFARFESIMSNLRACGLLAYTDNEHNKQLMHALDDHVWYMKITVLEESIDFAYTEKLFSKLKSYELYRKGRSNHDACFTSKAFITSAHVGGHDVNPTNSVKSALKFALSSLAAASDQQYESIPDDEIALLARKFHAFHKFHKQRCRSPSGCFECGDTTHFIVDCPKRKKFDSSNNYDYGNRNDCHTRFLSQNRMLIVCVLRNQVYTHTTQKMDTE